MNKIFVVMISLLTTSAFSQEIDYLKIAEVLLKDKNYARAKQTLTDAQKNLDDIDEQKFYLLKGLYLLRTNKQKDAIKSFNKITDSDLTTKKIIYLSESYLLLGDKTSALKWIRKIKITKDSSLSLKHLKVKILFQNELIKEALTIISNKTQIKWEQTQKILVHYLFKLNLIEEAFSNIKKITNRSKDITANIQMAKLLLTNKQYKKAIIILEDINLRWPNNPQATKLLATVYNLNNMPYIAGDLYTKVSYLDQTYTKLAADYLSQKGRNLRASYINMHVPHPQKKLKQKLSFYIGLERFDLANSLEIPLSQYGVYNDDEIKYAMAYSHLMQGNYQKSLALLNHIKNSKLINKSIKLIKLVNECKETVWECHGTL